MTTKKRKDVEVFSVSLPVRSKSPVRNKANLAKFAQQIEDIANKVRGDEWMSVQTMTFDGHGVVFIATREPEKQPAEPVPGTPINAQTMRMALPLWHSMSAALNELGPAYTPAQVEAVVDRFITSSNTLQAKELITFLDAQITEHKRVHPGSDCTGVQRLTTLVQIIESKVKLSVC